MTSPIHSPLPLIDEVTFLAHTAGLAADSFEADAESAVSEIEALDAIFEAERCRGAETAYRQILERLQANAAEAMLALTC